MANITITPANVLKGSGASIANGRAGGTITAGMAVYADASDSGDLKAAHCETSAATAAAVGIALHGASDGQPLQYLTSGLITIGGTVTVGELYVLSDSGGIAPEGDHASDDWVTFIGVGVSATQIRVTIIASGVQIP